MQVIKTSYVAAIVCIALFQSACATKPVPQPPYSIEQLNAFVNQDELSAAMQTKYFQKTFTSGVPLFKYSDLLKSNKPYEYKWGLINHSVPGALVYDIYLDGSVEVDEEHTPLNLIQTVSFDSEGYIATLNIDEFSSSDIKQINKLVHLKSLKLYGSDSYLVDDFNVDSLSDKLKLQAFSYSTIQAYNVSSLCKFNELEFIEISRAKVLGTANLTGCLPNLSYLSIAIANGEGVVIKDMPALEYLRVSDSNWDYVRIDGSTLPNIKSMTLGDLNIKNGFGDIKLPKYLTQLYLRESDNDDTSQLKLPEGLQYLDLQKAQLSDYSFITRAKSLRYLNLEASNFTQWALLKEFKNLEALNLNLSLVDNAALEEIAKLTTLDYLSFADTQVTDARPLAALKNLSYFNAGYAPITPEHFPMIETNGYVGFPSEEYYESQIDPEHIAKMKENTFEGSKGCYEAKVCTSPPWR